MTVYFLSSERLSSLSEQFTVRNYLMNADLRGLFQHLQFYSAGMPLLISKWENPWIYTTAMENNTASPFQTTSNSKSKVARLYSCYICPNFCNHLISTFWWWKAQEGFLQVTINIWTVRLWSATTFMLFVFMLGLFLLLVLLSP